jgi:hypothetical protein
MYMLIVSASSFETHKKILQVRGPSGSKVILYATMPSSLTIWSQKNCR